MAEQDLGWRAGEYLLDRDQQLPRPPSAVFGLRLPVVPGNAAALPLDQRSGYVGLYREQQALDPRHPGEIDIEQLAPVTIGRPCQVPVLRTEIDGKLAQP